MKKNIMIVMILALSCVFSLSVISALEINIPEEGEFYNSKTIDVSLSETVKSDFYYLDLSRRVGRWRKICRVSGMECMKSIRFKEGINDISFKSVSPYNSEIVTVKFIIDSKKPRLSKELPRRNLIVNGSKFSINYREDNPKRLTLFYGVAGDLRSASKTNLVPGKKTEDFEVNLSDFNNMKIYYWFEMEDDAGTITSTARNRNGQTVGKMLNVDTLAPIIVDKEISVVKNKVHFVFELKEENLDKISYRDLTSSNPKWRRLCSNLRTGRCDVFKSFKRGVHKFDVRALDKAGNLEMIYSGHEVVV